MSISSLIQLVPSPKWKLVVDIGPKAIKANDDPQSLSEQQNGINRSGSNAPNALLTNVTQTNGGSTRDPRLDDIVTLLAETMPHSQNSPYFSYLSNFISLRLMLLKPLPSAEDADMQSTLLSSYASYLNSGRTSTDIAVMIARDFMFLRQQNRLVHKLSPQIQPTLFQQSSPHQSIEQLTLSSHNNNNTYLGNNMNNNQNSLQLSMNHYNTNAMHHQFMQSNHVPQQHFGMNQHLANTIDSSIHSQNLNTSHHSHSHNLNTSTHSQSHTLHNGQQGDTDESKPEGI